MQDKKLYLTENSQDFQIPNCSFITFIYTLSTFNTFEY